MRAQGGSQCPKRTSHRLLCAPAPCGQRYRRLVGLPPFQSGSNRTMVVGTFLFVSSMHDHAVSFRFMQDPSGQVQKFMLEHGLSQAALAERAHVSQSTVSRALRGVPDRHSQARYRLLNFMRITESTFKVHCKGGIKRVVEAFDEIWDGSHAHAEAVANVIAALAGLRPIGSPKRRKRS